MLDLDLHKAWKYIASRKMTVFQTITALISPLLSLLILEWTSIDAYLPQAKQIGPIAALLLGVSIISAPTILVLILSRDSATQVTITAISLVFIGLPIAYFLGLLILCALNHDCL